MLLLFTLISVTTAITWCEHTTDNLTPIATQQVPSGFCLRHFAKVSTPRTLEFAANGDLFAVSPSSRTPGGAPLGLGGIYVLYDDNGDGVADVVNATYLENERTVHGIQITTDRLYYTTHTTVVSTPFSVGDRVYNGSALRNEASFPYLRTTGRWTHGLAWDKVNDKMYVSTGHYNENSCGSENPRVGAVLEIGPKNAIDGDVIVTHCRNPMYLKCVPWGCYAMELTGDSWGSRGGSEKLVKIVPGTNVGFPCCYQPNKPNNNFPSADCSKVTKSVADFRVQDTPFGFDWDHEFKWPGKWKGAMFIAFHGSFSSWRAAGLGYMLWNHTTHTPIGKEQQFFPSGFGRQGKIQVGRVADAKFHPDGRLFFCDDATGNIWWLAPTDLEYSGPPVPTASTTNAAASTTNAAASTTNAAASTTSTTTSNAAASTTTAATTPTSANPSQTTEATDTSQSSAGATTRLKQATTTDATAETTKTTTNSNTSDAPPLTSTSANNVDATTMVATPTSIASTNQSLSTTSTNDQGTDAVVYDDDDGDHSVLEDDDDFERQHVQQAETTAIVVAAVIVVVLLIVSGIMFFRSGSSAAARNER